MDVIHNNIYSSNVMSAVVCTDLSGKEPHKEVDIDRVIASGSLGGVIVSSVARTAKELGSIPTLGAIFPTFTLPHDTNTYPLYLFRRRYLGSQTLPYIGAGSFINPLLSADLIGCLEI